MQKGLSLTQNKETVIWQIGCDVICQSNIFAQIVFDMRFKIKRMKSLISQHYIKQK